MFAERLPGHWVTTLDDCEKLQAGRCSHVGIMDPCNRQKVHGFETQAGMR
jgi:hypothetical protein